MRSRCTAARCPAPWPPSHPLTAPALFPPVTQADGLAYSPDRSSGCTLYSGTLVAQARPPRSAPAALAMVVRTRFYSAKGQLLRSILHPREHSGSFISDSLKFIGVMLVVCIGLFIWAAVVLIQVGGSWPSAAFQPCACTPWP